MKLLLPGLLLLSLPISSQSLIRSGENGIPPEMSARIILDFTGRIEAEPGNGTLYHQRASVYLVQKDFAKAMDDLTKSIVLESDVRAESYFFRAILKQNANDPTACDDFSKSRTLGYENNNWETIGEMCGWD